MFLLQPISPKYQSQGMVRQKRPLQRKPVSFPCRQCWAPGGCALVWPFVYSLLMMQNREEGQALPAGCRCTCPVRAEALLPALGRVSPCWTLAPGNCCSTQLLERRWTVSSRELSVRLSYTANVYPLCGQLGMNSHLIVFRWFLINCHFLL